MTAQTINDNNLPIYFQRYFTDVTPSSSTAEYSCIGALPTNSIGNRLWTFIYEGTMLSSTPESIYDIDFSNVTPDDYIISFEGNISGTFEMYGNVYSANCLITYTYNSDLKTVTLRIKNPRVEKDKEGREKNFSFQIYINDDNDAFTNFSVIRMNVRLEKNFSPPRAYWAYIDGDKIKASEDADKSFQGQFVVYNEGADFFTDRNVVIDLTKNIYIQSLPGSCSEVKDAQFLYDSGADIIADCSARLKCLTSLDPNPDDPNLYLYKFISLTDGVTTLQSEAIYNIQNVQTGRKFFYEDECAVFLQSDKPTDTSRSFTWHLSLVQKVPNLFSVYTIQASPDGLFANQYVSANNCGRFNTPCMQSDKYEWYFYTTTFPSPEPISIQATPNTSFGLQFLSMSCSGQQPCMSPQEDIQWVIKVVDADKNIYTVQSKDNRYLTTNVPSGFTAPGMKQMDDAGVDEQWIITPVI